ncbi:thylakoid membrane protein slr0575 [Telopea speciosissima]|uniref:thylakoid membrane protein slr0575 n=1 Tax=Telopea speciosissima TaxID=54955 RepID=UPI001CC6B815|nr:thylakoid membrane protein slr0575 [Telopea speciosissima]XP_043716255.1 thylakoid membrane protein slr0575 [Telopea speciosissima]XP_043716256.1 thylakoid membrane protein slr0575 [Telopea speciosissima]XP_043716257.1 thylakoid membrane protein slr0575 [Telopea speciosissima]XP_043716258.1 thylakoid membrane protein slr0575 [Telopea speciosissima]
MAGAAAEALGGGTIVCWCHSAIIRDRRFIFSLDCPATNAPSLIRLRSRSLGNKAHYSPANAKPHQRRLVFLSRAADSTQSPSPASTAGKAIVPDDEFTLAKVSFGVIGLSVGITLLSYGFGAYFNILPGSEWSALMLTYGFPLAIIGMALKYAELKPVPCLTYSDAQMLRETCATSILKQVRNDVIRFRYGDEQHLDEALKRIFQYGQGGGIPRRSAPILQMIREEVTEDGKYCLVLVFEAKTLQLSDFEKRQAKFASFFGPGITAEVGKGENDLYEVRLISNTKL